ncbi:hypothetical protein E4T39_04682 [Aureobasidium subglaciale]|nr:hypothetical protein E4T39_04682 [Aureobasidium subglaciale]
MRSDLSNRSYLSSSHSASPRATPCLPSPSVYRSSLSPADTPHKRNRFRTLFFAPSVRDSGISLNAPTSNPRFPSPITPPCFPLPSIPDQEDPLIQEELDLLVGELTVRFGYQSSNCMVYPASDRCDSPTLGFFSIRGYHSSVPMASNIDKPLPPRRESKRSSSRKRGHPKSLPGASHLNTPVDLSIRELAVSSRVNDGRKNSPRPRPAVKPSSPLLGLPQVFRRIAITDPHVNGQPIRFLSPDYVAGANGLQVGSCTFMNLPYGEDVECGLRVEPSFPRTASRSQVVILQIVQRIVRVRNGSSVWLLCSEVDVSTSFTREVRAELALTASTPPPLSTKGKQKQHTDTDIWVALAQQLETDSYAPSTTRLPTSSTNPLPQGSTPALSDLLSLLTEIRFLHRQAFILQPETSKTGGLEMEVPYLSNSLYTSLLSFPSPTRLSAPTLNIHGHDTSSYTTTTPNTPLAVFLAAATSQAKDWAKGVEQGTRPTILRKVLKLPKMSKSESKDEQIGVYGVGIGEGWGKGSRGLGCWVCFLVPNGVEMEL